MSLIGDLIIDRGPLVPGDSNPLWGLTRSDFNALRQELIELRRPGGVTHDRINAARGIVPMTLEQARQVVAAVLDLRAEPEPASCDEETWSWENFGGQQTDGYWITCDLRGPHNKHKDAHTGLTWKTSIEEKP